MSFSSTSNERPSWESGSLVIKERSSSVSPSSSSKVKEWQCARADKMKWMETVIQWTSEKLINPFWQSENMCTRCSNCATFFSIIRLFAFRPLFACFKIFTSLNSRDQKIFTHAVLEKTVEWEEKSCKKFLFLAFKIFSSSSGPSKRLLCSRHVFWSDRRAKNWRKNIAIYHERLWRDELKRTCLW